jgi:hypothetical protein
MVNINSIEGIESLIDKRTMPLKEKILKLRFELEELKQELLIQRVSKSFAVGVEVEITDRIKGHEFHMGEKVTIVGNEDYMWICRNKKGVEWYINEDEANVC